MSTEAAKTLMAEMRAGAVEALSAAKKNVLRLKKQAEERAALEREWCEARGGASALGTLRTSLIRYKHWRLERRRQEALGLCIATAQAKVAHRHGKRTLSEVAGSRELLSTLKQQQATLPRPTPRRGRRGAPRSRARAAPPSPPPRPRRGAPPLARPGCCSCGAG